MPFSRGSSRPMHQTCISCIAGGFFTCEPLGRSLTLVYYAFFGKTSNGNHAPNHCPHTTLFCLSFQSPKVFNLLYNWAHFMLERICSKSFKLGFSSTWTKNFQMHTLAFKEAEEPEIKLQTFVGSWRKQESSRKTSTFVSLTTLKPLTVWITTNCGKFFRRGENQTTLPVSKKPVCWSRSNSWNWTWNNGLVQNWERNVTRLYIVTLLI